MSQTGPWGSTTNPGYPPQRGPVPANPWPQARPGWQATIPNPGWQQPASGQRPAYQPGYPPPVGPQTYPQVIQAHAYPRVAQPQAYQPVQPQVYASPVQATWAPPGASYRPAKKKSSALPIIIIVALILVVAIPVAMVLSHDPNPSGKPTVGQTNPTPPPSGPNQYTPGPADLNPGDPPMPTTYGELWDALKRNPLYNQTMPSSAPCTINSMDIATVSASSMEAYMNDFMECLMYAWYPPIYDSDFWMHRPSVTVYTTAVNTPCGETPMHNAFFCGANQQLYYSLDLADIFSSTQRTTRLTVESIMAHEFAHAAQFRVMILWSDWYLESEAESEEEAWEYSRRAEMQADCFAGLFMRTITESAGLTGAEHQSAASIFGSIGSSAPYMDDHGMGANRKTWFERGLNSTSPGACNTWEVSADQVG